MSYDVDIENLDPESNITVDDLASLPDGLYAVVIYARSLEQYSVEGGADYKNGTSHETDLQDAMTDGTAMVFKNVKPRDLPGTYETAKSLIVYGFWCGGGDVEDSDVLASLSASHGFHCMTMEDYVEMYCASVGGSNAIH